MFRHKIAIELDDAVVDQYSIQEWETILLANGVIERDQLPLSYGAIAEIICVELYKYRHFQGVEDTQWKCKEETWFVNELGWECNTKVPRMDDAPTTTIDNNPTPLMIGSSTKRY